MKPTKHNSELFKFLIKIDTEEFRRNFRSEYHIQHHLGIITYIHGRKRNKRQVDDGKGPILPNGVEINTHTDDKGRITYRLTWIFGNSTFGESETKSFSKVKKWLKEIQP